MNGKIVWIGIAVLCLTIIGIMAMGHADATIGLNAPAAIHGHAIISINGNAAFTWANGVRSGDGSSGNPYIISNWNIDCNGTTNGIDIQSTSKYFVIRNCRIYNATTGTYISGIEVHTIAQGYGRIENCELYNCANSILFVTTHNITVNNSLIRDGPIGGGRGLWFYSENWNIRVHNNTIQNFTYEIIMNWGGGPSLMNSRFDHNLIKNATAYGVIIYGSAQISNHLLQFDNNTFDNLRQVGFLGGSFVSFLNNRIINGTPAANYNSLLVWWVWNGTIRSNFIKNSSKPSSGINVRCQDNLIENNTIVNCMYAGIGLYTGPEGNAHRAIVRGNLIVRQFVYKASLGDGGIVIQANNCIIENNTVIGSTDRGIATVRSTVNSGGIIRYNHCSNSFGYEIDVEHNSTGFRVYGNTVENGAWGIVAEGRSSLVYDNIINDCEVGTNCDGQYSIFWNNTITDCRFGIMSVYDEHGGANLAIADDTQIYDNIVSGGEFSIMFLWYSAEENRYPINVTIYNNDLSGFSNSSICFGRYFASESNGGENYTISFSYPTLIPNPYDTENFVIRTRGISTVYGYDISEGFTIMALWNSSYIHFEVPDDWSVSAVQVYDQNETNLVPWVEGSVKFEGEENHIYELSYIIANFSSTHIERVRYTFTDNSTGRNLTYLWDFGDGSSSTDQNPDHNYSAGGNYTVSLTVTDIIGGMNMTSMVITVITDADQVNSLMPVMISIAGVVVVIVGLGSFVIRPFNRLFKKMW